MLEKLIRQCISEHFKALFLYTLSLNLHELCRPVFSTCSQFCHVRFSRYFIVRRVQNEIRKVLTFEIEVQFITLLKL